MHKPESFIENETHEILGDFEILMDHLILTRRSNPVLINKKRKICRLMDFAVTVNLRVKMKMMRKSRQILGSCKRIKIAGEHEHDSDN